MNTATDTLVTKTMLTTGGLDVGQSATTDYVGFYAATPIVQPTNASQSAVTIVTNSAGGTGSYTTGLQAISGTFNSTLLANAFATVAAQSNANAVLVNQLRSDLVSLGLIKGS